QALSRLGLFRAALLPRERHGAAYSRQRDRLGWQEAPTLYLVAQFHRCRFTMNFWVPLQDCGIDSPSLQMVPLDYLTTRAYSRFTGRRLRHCEAYQQGFFTEHGLDVREVTRAFGPAALLHPIMRTGDLIVASNWLIH